MTITLKIVDPESTSTSLLDLNGQTTIGSGTFTLDIVTDVDWGSPEMRLTVADTDVIPAPQTTFHQEALAHTKFSLRARGSSLDVLIAGLGLLDQYLSNGCVIRWIPTGASDTKFVDVEPSKTPVLIGGQELALYHVSTLVDVVVDVTFDRQPFFRGAALTPSTNALSNATMLRDANADGTPDGWTLVNGTFTIDSTVDALSITQNSAVGLVRQQAAFSAGTVVVASIEAWVTSGDRTAQLVLQSQAGGTTLATTNITATGPGTRVSATGTVAGGDTAARLLIQLSGGSTSTTVKLRNAHLGTGTTDPLFRVGSETVTVDPAATSGFVNILPVFNPGSAPSPCSIQATFPDALNSTYAAVMAERDTETIQGRHRLADYLNGPNYAQAESSSNGWTVTLGTDTATAAGGATASGSGSNVARVTHATAITSLTKRVSWERTTLMDCLRGEFDVYVRVLAASAKNYGIQLRWAMGNVSPLPNQTLEYNHNVTDATVFQWVLVNLGRISIPEETDVATLTKLKFELWTRVHQAPAQNLDVDYIRLVPADSATLNTPASNQTTWLADELGSNGGTAINVIGALGYFDGTGDSASSPSITDVGHHRTTWIIGSGANVDRSVRLVIRNVTDSTDEISRTLTVKGNTSRLIRQIDWDAATAKTYEVRMDTPSGVSTTNDRNIFVRAFRDRFIPVFEQNSKLRTDPGSRPSRYAVEKLDSSGNIALTMESTTVPFWVPPGLSLIYLDAWDPPPKNYDENKHVLTRTMTVQATIYPRWWT